MDRIKCAFAGLGRIASLLEDDKLREKPCTHAGAVFADPGCEIICGCDLLGERRELFRKRWGSPSVYPDIRSMLDREKPDILFVATHPDSHLEMVSEAVRHGIPVIVCEKPLADSLEKAKKIADFHREGKAKIIVNHERRYSADYIAVKKKIEEKTYGELLSIKGTLFMGRDKIIEKVLWHDGTHMADAIMYLTGSLLEKKHIEGDIGASSDTAYIYASAGNIPCLIEAGTGRDHLVFELSLSFGSGRIDIGNGIYREWKSLPSPYYENFRSLMQTEIFEFKKTGYFSNMIKDAVRAFREPDHMPVSTALDGYDAVRFLDSLRRE